MHDDATLRALAAAVTAAPESLALRVHYARVLLGAGRVGEAEGELRKVLSRAPEEVEARLALVEAFRRGGKLSEAHVVLEALLAADVARGRTYLEQARTFLEQGAVQRAVHAYRRALQEDPELVDAELARRLGMERPIEASALVEGRMRAPAGHADAEAPLLFPLERPPFGFDGVGGMERLKAEIDMKIVQPMKQPELFKAYGKKVGGGILMYGPPGCGKTHLARATAGHVDAPFLCIGLHDVLSMWMGESEQRLHAIFEQARANRPCVLFFDEVDALGAKRADLRTSAGRTTINVFLSELDGAAADNEGLLVLAATNAPWHVDPAFRRPGRFDRVLFVPPPDVEARAAILRILLAEKPTRDVDVEKIAGKTKDCSGADLKAILDVAIEGKLEAALETRVPEPLTTKDLLEAAKRRRPTTKEWFGTARNHALYSNEGGLYDDVLAWLGIA